MPQHPPHSPAQRPLRAVLYARYSTDKQRESSIDDQLRAARERAAREGWHIVAQHADDAVSGSTPVAMRPGGKALLADALAARFDVLVLEGLDRLSREVGEAETITKRLEHRGIRIVGTADGYDTEARGRKVMRIARGLVNELYLDDLREKTHRGLAGQFDRGFHTGGVTYGYRTVDAGGGRGRHLVVDDDQAHTVVEIFQRFADGHSPRQIVYRLNELRVPAPRGGSWAVSALVGDSTRGAGVLNNELYVGRVVWNRRQWLKDPETGKRRYVDRPQHEWQVREQPELRIVPAELWELVRSRIHARPTGRTGRPAQTLLGGLLRCATCGGAVVAIDARRYGCSVRKDRGATVCSSDLTARRQDVDRRILASVREELLSPAALAELQQLVHELLEEHQRHALTSTAGARRRLDELQGEVSRLVDAVVSVGISPAIAARLRAAEEERAQLEADLAAAGQAMPRAVVDDVVGRYKQQLVGLQAALEAEQDRDRTRKILADLLGPITLQRDPDGSIWAQMRERAEQLAIAVGAPLSLVAGGRNATWKRLRIR